MFGALALVLYTFPYLGLFFIPLILFYVSAPMEIRLIKQYLCASYYRHTSREVKRVESLLRSHVYSFLAEQLSGLAVIRAFGQQGHFQSMLQGAVNDQMVCSSALRRKRC
jgi:ATP-binding cassette subfamily C (CFTR/MRP) protein 1